MNDDQWDLKLKTFLKKTGDDLKRAGQDMKTEAERLLAEVKDPQKQQQVKAGLKDLGTWATRTAHELAVLIESGVKKAEATVRTAVDAPTPTPTDTAPVEPVAPVEPPVAPPPSAPARKSIGQKKVAAPKSKATATKKTIGKK